MVYDFVAAGEVLIDMLSLSPSHSLLESSRFEKLFGGSPANLTVNLHRLGCTSTLIAKVGAEPLGDFLRQRLQAEGIRVDYVTRHPSQPTSLVVVTSQHSPPEFVAYRQADRFLEPADLPDFLIQSARVFHTTAHAVALEPSQSSILEAYCKAHRQGVLTSLDPNYSESFWPDRHQAQQVLGHFLRHTSLCKASSDDCQRLFGAALPHRHIDWLHQLGAQTVILTLGPEGVIYSPPQGPRVSYPAHPCAEVVDTTGAGDAFLAGYYAAWLRQGDPDLAVRTGLKAAALNLAHRGALAPLPRLEALL